MEAPKKNMPELSQFSENYDEIINQLKDIYAKKIAEGEKRYQFDDFHFPIMRGSDFEAKPMVMLLGQYSVGKTSFIEYMLGRPFPGQRIGPEPTTDRFVAVMHGKEEQIIPGNALSVDADRPFHALNQFGTGFLSKFEGAIMNAPLLERITFIDTPGVLSGEKQRIGRSYEFVQVIEWYANRSDMILLLFDAHKLDISDELKSAIDGLRGNEDKIRVILNKADTITSQQLMRVYGALMWSLGRVIRSPEVLRVYIGSFWEHPYQNQDNARLFEAEKRDLLEDLLGLPRNAAVRKINELVKRTRLVRAHAHIISHLQSKMPVLFYKDSTKQELIDNLEKEFREVEKLKKIPFSDFPNVKKMQELLKLMDFSKFSKPSDRLFEQIEQALTVELPRLMKLIGAPKEQDTNPFSEDRWVVEDSFEDHKILFESLNPAEGRLTGLAAKETILATKLPQPFLHKIWELCDLEKKGSLDVEEFALFFYLVNYARAKGTVPETLTKAMIPPSKRKDTSSQKTNPF